jgi:hypothetical protein
MRATLNFLSGVVIARLSNEESNTAAPAMAVHCKNSWREIEFMISNLKLMILLNKLVNHTRHTSNTRKP